MRLGGKVFDKPESPEHWVALHRAAGWRAAYCPVWPSDSDADVAAYAAASIEHDLPIAETSAWSNPISPDPEQRAKAIDKCIAMLDLAERVGARCCVNLSGSMNPDDWHGPHADNYSAACFDRIVRTVQDIIDQAKPTRTFYTLEMMNWALPDSPASYLELIKAIDRPQFAVHFDPVNLINTPRRYFDNASLVREVVAELGPRIKSVHLKDVVLRPTQLVHLDECRPGEGGLDYAALFGALDGLDMDLPLMLEHLPDAEEYRLAAEHVRGVAAGLGLAV